MKTFIADTFDSISTSVEGVWQDLLDFFIGQRHTEGRAQPSAGISSGAARGKVQTAEEVMLIMDGIDKDHRAAMGGFASNTTETHPDDTYQQRRFDFLSSEEGTRTRAYDDATGQPLRKGRKVKGNVTIGIGFNMEAKGARDTFAMATGLTDEDFNAAKKGNLVLSREQVRGLFDETASQAERFVHNKFKGVNLMEHERLALVSMAFNSRSLIGPNLESFVRTGKIPAARDEILFKSNLRLKRGVAGRRYREAAMFVGPGIAESNLPPFDEYISRFTG